MTALSLDLFRYFVNVEQNVAFMDPVCIAVDDSRCTKPAWGQFSTWKGRLPYFDFLVDRNGQLGKCPFKDSWVPCPKESVKIMTVWNGGEYVRPNPHVPQYGLCIPVPEVFRSKPAFVQSHMFQPSPEDLAELCWKALQFAASGYQSFVAYFLENCVVERAAVARANVTPIEESQVVFPVVSHPDNVHQRDSIRKS